MLTPVFDCVFSTEFPTTRLEMEAVANIFDSDGDGYIDYKEFIAALRPDRDVRLIINTETWKTDKFLI